MTRVLALAAVGLLLGTVDTVAQPGTAFTYQGRLADDGVPANGTFDFQLILYTAPTGGSQVGIVTANDVDVANGVFTTSLDFGAVFTGPPRWLEISVRPGASTGLYTILSPRQEVTPTPYALLAQHAANATTVNGLTCANNNVAKWSGSGWACGTDIDTNTTYSAGTGINLAGTVFSVNSSVARKDAAAGNQAFDTDLLFLDYTNDRVGIGTTTPRGPIDVVGGTAPADAFGRGINMEAQGGGADGGDVGDIGGAGGSISLAGGQGGPAAASGSILIGGRPGGDATIGSGGGTGGRLNFFGGAGGNTTTTMPGGIGGDVALSAGAGGDSATAGQAGLGGPMVISAGAGGTNIGGGGLGGAGGSLQIRSGAGGSANGAGGNLTLTSGNGSGSGTAGEIRLVPGTSSTGIDGAIELGPTTTNANTGGNGPITVHVVFGDMNFATAGKGIILRSPNGTTCRLLTISDAGVLQTNVIACP